MKPDYWQLPQIVAKRKPVTDIEYGKCILHCLTGDRLMFTCTHCHQRAAYKIRVLSRGKVEAVCSKCRARIPTGGTYFNNLRFPYSLIVKVFIDVASHRAGFYTVQTLATKYSLSLKNSYSLLAHANAAYYPDFKPVTIQRPVWQELPRGISFDYASYRTGKQYQTTCYIPGSGDCYVGGFSTIEEAIKAQDEYRANFKTNT